MKESPDFIGKAIHVLFSVQFPPMSTLEALIERNVRNPSLGHFVDPAT